ncbi:hypothetical protein D3C76_143570 [compost metagenome]
MARCHEELTTRSCSQLLLIGVLGAGDAVVVTGEPGRQCAGCQALDVGMDYLMIGRGIGQTAAPAKALVAVGVEIRN